MSPPQKLGPHVYAGEDTAGFDDILLASAVPEPSTTLLLALGIACIAAAGRLGGSTSHRPIFARNASGVANDHYGRAAHLTQWRADRLGVGRGLLGSAAASGQWITVR
jgi:hypothetical protein